MKFLLESLEDLHSNLQKRKSQLLVGFACMLLAICLLCIFLGPQSLQQLFEHGSVTKLPGQHAGLKGQANRAAPQILEGAWHHAALLRGGY